MWFYLENFSEVTMESSLNVPHSLLGFIWFLSLFLFDFSHCFYLISLLVFNWFLSLFLFGFSPCFCLVSPCLGGAWVTLVYIPLLLI